jgi:hypothetical protein
MAALILVSCTARKESSPTAARAAAGPAKYVFRGTAELGGQSVQDSVRSDIAPAQLGSATPPDREAARIPGDRKLVRRGEMTIEVRSVTTAVARLGQIIASVGGHRANESERQNEYGARTASVTCRVPAERLDAAIESIKALGSLRTLTLNAEDITTAYFDVSVRIATQTQLERQLVGILQRPTNKLSDLLEIEREIARVREEIDRMEGRKRAWDNEVALSSLVVTIEEPAQVVAGTGGGPLRTLAQSFREAAENFVLAVASIIAATGAILPVALLLGGGSWIVFRLWRRHQRGAVPAV